MRDRQNKPVDDAIFWVEYIVRHKGAKHLSVPYVDMPLYEVYMLDILALTFVGLVIISVLSTYVVIKISDYIKTRPKKPTSSKKSSKKQD